VRRTQLYLDDDLWQMLHTDARHRGTTVSNLVRQVVREKYTGSPAARIEAMRNFVGARKGRRETQDATEYIREMRGGSRLAALRNP
jgi:hypothetical protein